MKKLVLAVGAVLSVGAAFAASYNVSTYVELTNALVSVVQSGDEVVIAASDEPYVLAAALTVPAGVTVRGATDDYNDVVLSGDGKAVGLVLSEGSKVRGLTISSCKDYAGVTTAKDAVLDNCRVTACWRTSNTTWDSTGISITASGGTVTNCVVDGNYSTVSTHHCGNILIKSATLLTYATVTNNWQSCMASDNPNYSGCPGIKAKAGTIDHCYIADNYYGVDHTHSITIGSAIYATAQVAIKHCSIFNHAYDAVPVSDLYGVWLGNANCTISDTIIFGNGHSEGLVNDFGVTTSMAASKCSNVVTGNHREMFDGYVAYKATADDFVRVGGKWIPKPDSPAAGCGSEPAWDGVTPVDPPPSAGTTYYVDDVANLQSTINGAKSGDTVIIKKGTYLLTAQLSITTPYLTVRGETDDFNDVKLDGQNKVRCASLSGRGATLMNVSLIRGLAANGGYGAGVNLEYSTCLRHCRVGDIAAKMPGSVYGVGVAATGAKVIDCVIEDITSTSQSNYRALGAFLRSSSLMDRCIVRRCIAPTTAFSSSNYSSGRGVLGVLVDSGVVQNCCIYGNSHGTITSTTYMNSGACYLAGANSAIYNSFVYGNTYNGDSDDVKSYGIYNEDKAKVVNCVSLDNGPKDGTLSHNFIGRSYCKNCLADAASIAGATDCRSGTLVDHFTANGDLWKLKGASPLVDGGLATFGVEGLDLDGTNRLEGAAIDVGPWEYHKPALGVALDAGTYEAFDRLETTLTATPEGDATGIGYAWYLDDAATPFAEGGDKQSVPLVLSEVGTYVVKVVVTNADAAVASTERTFKVHQGTFVVNPGESISAAIADAEPGATVLLKTGVHTNAALISVNKAITIRGESRDETVITGTNKVCGVSLKVAGATLADLTVTDCYGSYAHADGLSGVRLEAGTVMSNCVVRNCTAGGTGPEGAGVCAVNGRIFDSVISNCTGGSACYIGGPSALMVRTFVCGNKSSGVTAGDDYIPLGTGMIIDGGEVRDSVIADNEAMDSNWTKGYASAAMSASGVLVWGGKLVNCTVVGNTFTMKASQVEVYAGLAGAVACGGGTVVNCLIADNWGNDGVPYDNALDRNRPSYYTTCCTSAIENFPEGNKSSVPGPVYRYSKRLGEYRLTQGSPCAGAGTWQTWMEGAPDIYGRAWNPDRVDIGAAVYDCKGLMLLLK